jgi:hypothetical protein
MEDIMKKMTILISCLLASAASASENLPELSQPVQIENIQVFPSAKSLMWFAPMAFSSELDCSPGAISVNKACILRIYNRMSDDERSAMVAMLKPGQQLASFRDIDSVTQSVNESFTDLNPGMKTGASQIMNTLVMDNRYSYDSLGIEVSGTNAQNLKNAYEMDGLGTFKAVVKFQGEYTGDYIAIKDSTLIRNAVEKLSDNPATPCQTKAALKDAVSASVLITNNFDQSEAATIAVSQLISSYFRVGHHGLLYPVANVLDRLSTELLLVNETDSPVNATCTATLSLKQGAQSTVECSEAL